MVLFKLLYNLFIDFIKFLEVKYNIFLEIKIYCYIDIIGLSYLVR